MGQNDPMGIISQVNFFGFWEFRESITVVDDKELNDLGSLIKIILLEVTE